MLTGGGALLTNLPFGGCGAGVCLSTGTAWGTSYAVGVLANNLVKLDSSARLPAVSGELLTNLPGSTFTNIGSGTNTTGTFVCGTGCSMAPSGTGAVKASEVVGAAGTDVVTVDAADAVLGGLLNASVGGGVVAIDSVKCTTALVVSATSDWPVEQFPYAITIKTIHVYQTGATNVIGGLDECTGTAGVCSSVVAVDADITGTDGVQVADDGALTNGTIAAGNRIMWHTTSVSGTNVMLQVCFTYTVD